MNRAPLIIRDGKQPFLVIIVLLAVVGAAGLVGPGFRSNAIEAAWGTGWAVAWYLQVLAFALYTLAAVMLPRGLVRALEFERIGMYGVGYTCLAYVPAAIQNAGLPGMTAAGMFLGFAFGTGVRIRHIHVDLAKLRPPRPRRHLWRRVRRVLTWGDGPSVSPRPAARGGDV